MYVCDNKNTFLKVVQYYIQKLKFCHYLFTLKFFQIFVKHISSVEHENVFTVDGSHWLP